MDVHRRWTSTSSGLWAGDNAEDAEMNRPPHEDASLGRKTYTFGTSVYLLLESEERGHQQAERCGMSRLGLV